MVVVICTVVSGADSVDVEVVVEELVVVLVEVVVLVVVVVVDVTVMVVIVTASGGIGTSSPTMNAGNTISINASATNLTHFFIVLLIRIVVKIFRTPSPSA